MPFFLGVTALPPVSVAQSAPASTLIAASDIGSRGVVGQGFSDPSRTRVDRTIVSPFETGRRMIARPDGMEEFEPATVSRPAPGIVPAPSAVGARAVSPALTVQSGDFIDIGALDQPVPPASPPPVPAAVAQFLDLGPYDAISGPSIFPPD